MKAYTVNPLLAPFGVAEKLSHSLDAEVFRFATRGRPYAHGIDRVEQPTVYTVRPGIAALVDVFADGEPVGSYVFLAMGKPVEKSPATRAPFDKLPTRLRAAINKHFAVVFSIPCRQRGEYLRAVGSFSVEVSQ